LLSPGNHALLSFDLLRSWCDGRTALPLSYRSA
jgi:hypothetical protein